MYCEKCGYGSDSCKFQATGALVEITVGKDRDTVGVSEYRCPQCGTLGAHLRKAPTSNERTRSIHPSRSQANKNRRSSKEEPFSDSPHKALKALDYSKNAPAV